MKPARWSWAGRVGAALLGREETPRLVMPWVWTRPGRRERRWVGRRASAVRRQSTDKRLWEPLEVPVRDRDHPVVVAFDAPALRAPWLAGGGIRGRVWLFCRDCLT